MAEESRRLQMRKIQNNNKKELLRMIIAKVYVFVVPRVRQCAMYAIQFP